MALANRNHRRLTLLRKLRSEPSGYRELYFSRDAKRRTEPIFPIPASNQPTGDEQAGGERRKTSHLNLNQLAFAWAASIWLIGREKNLETRDPKSCVVAEITGTGRESGVRQNGIAEEELARRIVQGDASGSDGRCTIYSLDIGSLAGTKYAAILKNGLRRLLKQRADTAASCLSMKSILHYRRWRAASGGQVDAANLIKRCFPAARSGDRLNDLSGIQQYF